MSYVIEQGIEPPAQLPRRGGRPASEEHTLMMAMQVGESFMVHDYLRWLFLRGKLTKMRPRKFSMRKVPGGWRLWRVA
jgi:hypothetical protein